MRRAYAMATPFPDRRVSGSRELTTRGLLRWIRVTLLIFRAAPGSGFVLPLEMPARCASMTCEKLRAQSRK
jgi:hypothetical protein